MTKRVKRIKIASAAEAIKQLKASKKGLGMERDKLRDVMAELEELEMLTEDALQSLDDAIEALSQYV